MKLVLATRNKGKVKELKELLKSLNVEILDLDEFPEIAEVIEDGSSFEENAAKKAAYAAKETGLYALADDSGLEVDYLDGLPGIYSARFAGENKDDKANNEKLLQALAGVPFAERTARFKCVIAVAADEQDIVFSEGICRGYILTKKKGQGGFGYDPLFYIPELKKTMAELSLEEKNQISHRSIALRKAYQIIKGRLLFADRCFKR